MTTPPRFTDAEVLEITAVAAPLIAVRSWSHLERDSGQTCDCVFIWLLQEDVCHYRLERDQTGQTHLLWCTSCDWRLVTSGTLSDCLSAFRQRS
jgi:hypothetical protein